MQGTGQSSIFCTQISNFSKNTICWNHHHFSNNLPLKVCSKSIAYIWLGLFLYSSFCFIHLCFYLYTKSHCFDFYNFKISLEIWYNLSPNIVFFIRVLFILSALYFYVILELPCQFLKQGLLGFWLGWHQIYMLFCRELTSSILGLLIYQHGM